MTEHDIISGLFQAAAFLCGYLITYYGLLYICDRCER